MTEPRFPLARLAGAFLAASVLFAVAAVAVALVYEARNPVAVAFLVAGAGCLLAWLVGRVAAKRDAPPLSRDAASKTRALFGLNAISTLVLLAAILVGVNYVANRRNRTFDLTVNRANSLAPQTLQTIEKLPRPVELSYYFADELDPQVQALLQTYDRASDKVQVNYVNVRTAPSQFPDSLPGAPALVAQLSAEQKATSKAALEEIAVVDEQNITSTLLKLTTPQARKLFFLTSHGEITPAQLNEAARALEVQNYELETLSLAGKDAQIPDDAAALVALAPQTDLAPNELQKLRAFVGGDGDLVLMFSPPREGAKFARWNELLQTLGMKLNRGFVADAQQAYQSAELPIGVREAANPHPVIRGTSADVIFPGAAVIQITDPQRATPLFQTSEVARILGAQGATQTQAPFVLAAVSEREKSRALVVSSASLLSDDALELFGNRSFWQSSINWTAGNDALVSIPPKPPSRDTLQMPAPTQRFAAVLSLLILPFLALFLGALTWWRRR